MEKNTIIVIGIIVLVLIVLAFMSSRMETFANKKYQKYCADPYNCTNQEWTNCYFRRYPELVGKVANNYNSAAKHFMNIGKAEGKIWCCNTTLP